MVATAINTTNTMTTSTNLILTTLPLQCLYDLWLFHRILILTTPPTEPITMTNYTKNTRTLLLDYIRTVNAYTLPLHQNGERHYQ